MASKLRSDQLVLLRELLQGERSRAELTERVKARSSSVKRSLGSLRAAGVVEPVDADDEENGLDRVWRLTDDGRARVLADHRPTPARASRLRGRSAPHTRGGGGQAANAIVHQRGSATVHASQSFVATSLKSSEVPDLLAVLAAGEVAASAATVARLDGQEHNYLFLFDPGQGAGPAEELSGLLYRRGTEFRLGTVADVRTFEQFLDDSRRASPS